MIGTLIFAAALCVFVCFWWAIFAMDIADSVARDDRRTPTTDPATPTAIGDNE